MNKKRFLVLLVVLLTLVGVSLLSLPLFGPEDQIQVYRAEVMGEAGHRQVSDLADLQAVADILKDAKRSLLPRSVGPQVLRPGDVELGVLVGDESYHIYLSAADKHSNYCYRVGRLGHNIRAADDLHARLLALLS